MARVEIYTTLLCGYCLMAKRLLARKGVDFEEINVGFRPGRRREMVERTGGRYTVPQIFIDGEGIGGYDELVALDRGGELESLLAPDA